MKMGIWKYLFAKSSSSDQFESPLPIDYRELTKKTIELIGRDSKTMENEQLHEYLISYGIPDFEAREFLVFLPAAFCRRLLQELDWPLIYIDYYSEKKKIKRRYTDNKRYLVMQEETEKYWTGTPDNDWILNIAGRSAEFNAINQLLKDGGKLEDVTLTESYVVR